MKRIALAVILALSTVVPSTTFAKSGEPVSHPRMPHQPRGNTGSPVSRQPRTRK